ncbi:ferrous iron transporter FeoB [Longilinea arvoryzae]|uniref:Ferrous iron transport protein B n=1 Tax=Longilinea arvoryzae TaxID=360412 RepID=A0A0K8MXQ2_9CHLR|nr:ferrous iron transport protein B [Longilinea arvoryzae]GAP16038.1 ferrous iron transporter FeoB [Longilinea arvoryzae]
MHCNLLDLQPERAAVVQRIEGGKTLLSRMAAMGFTPGAMITVIRRGDHGPLLVSLRGSRVALGQGEAGHIFVTLAEAKPPASGVASANNFTIALAGQPNVGKSSVFNSLTGLNQHVGNWTGKTVECKTGAFTYKDTNFNLIDLPGTYSLTASSEEERIARDYIIQQRPDLIVAVVNAAALEHSLYLVAEILLLPAPIVLALNMTDVAEQEGLQVEPKVLEAALGIPVVPMAASRGAGIPELEEAILRMSRHELPFEPRRPSILPAHKPVLDQLRDLIGPYVPPGYPEDWVALKLLEGDEELSRLIDASAPPEVSEKVHALLYQHEDAILDIAGARYEWVARVIRAAVVEPQVTRVGLTTRLDRVLTHPIWGTVSLIAILGATFWLTYQVGSPIQAWLSRLLGLLAESMRANWTGVPKWLVEFSAGGVLGGIGMVLTFLPILVIFFFILGLMEDTGYMARAAYVTDRWMHMMGLHGKSFLPILLGFGCNVPAVMGTRIIESPRARLLTTLLIPLVPCTARMAVITVLAGVFFGANAFWIAWGLVGLCLVLLAGFGFLLHHFFFGNEHVPFIMELPLYHLPNRRTIGFYVKDNVLGFLKKAGTTILVASLVVWGLSYFPSGNVMSSYLGQAGKFLEPVGKIMGLPWPLLVALLTSFVAKENTIATLGILYGNLGSLTGVVTPLAMLAFLVFQILFVPCVGTVAAIRQETHSWKWTAASIGAQLALSLGLATAVYQIGSLF